MGTDDTRGASGPAGDEQDARGGLWDDAWAKAHAPAGERMHARGQWDPSERAASPPAGPRGARRRADVDSRGVGHEFRDVRMGAPSEGGQAAFRGRPGADARSLAPHRAVVDYHSRRRGVPAVAVLAAAAVAVVALGAFGWWFLTRPTALALAADPPDARISVRGRTGTGTLDLGAVEAGSYVVEVSRTGFETRTASVEVGRWRQVRETVRLTPLPLRIAVTSRPKGASVTVTASDGRAMTGSTPCTFTALAGTATVELREPGCRPFRRTVFLDEARSFDLLLDPEGQLVTGLGSMTTAGAPKAVAVTPDGREAWSAILNSTTSLEVFDLRTLRRLGGVSLGQHGAVEVVFSRDGTKAYASQMETAKVFEIDVATRQVLRSFKTGSSWTKVVALAPDGKRLYAANWSGNDVSVISLVTGELLKRIPTAKTPRGLWPTADGRSLYVAGFDRGEIQRIDLETWEVRTLFKSGGAMRHLVADEKRGVLYASDMGKDAVWALDMATGGVRRFCTTDHKPNTIALSRDGRVLFISNRGENNPRSYYIPGHEWGSVLLYDTATGRPLDAVVGGNQCTALDVSRDGRTLVFSDFLDNRLRVYSVPAYPALRDGGGGRYRAHFAALRKSR